MKVQGKCRFCGKEELSNYASATVYCAWCSKDQTYGVQDGSDLVSEGPSREETVIVGKDQLIIFDQPVDATLKDRGEKYGPFIGHATIAQGLKAVLHKHPNWAKLTDDKKESLEMIQHKIARILNGDADYKDSWTDIIGYARLVEKALN